MNIEELAEAHLLNVQQEISRLEEQRDQLDNRIKEMNNYLNEGAMVLDTERSKKAETASTSARNNIFP